MATLSRDNYEPFKAAARLKNRLKNPVRTSKRTPHFPIAKNNWLALFQEIIAVLVRTYTTHRHKMQT
jgi:hypothetical protein